jgi:UDP-glucuronate 4-epimerase
MKILVTGAAGFIGMHTALKLLDLGHQVIGIDNLNDYYDVQLKLDRLNQISSKLNFQFLKIDIADRLAISNLFSSEQFDKVVHLAAQAGVRYSITNPTAYIDSNLVGFGNILEGCRHTGTQHLVYASSSSVYGGNKKMPFSEDDGVDHPVSLYAATKKSNELMAHSYSHLYGTPTTGLRFFTVYGPWGRPDMAPMLFAKAAFSGEAIKVFNNGQMSRDFTYIDDVVEGIALALDRAPSVNDEYDSVQSLPNSSRAPYRIFNIGNSSPVPLLDFISAIENQIGVRIEKIYLPMQDGDVQATYADTSLLRKWIGSSPSTPIDAGVKSFVDWYRDYFALTKI